MRTYMRSQWQSEPRPTGMGWASFYSQGHFDADEDATGYAIRVGLYGLVPLLLPLALAVAAIIIIWVPPISTNHRWAMVLPVIPAIGLVAWAVAITATASPIEQADIGISPIQVLSSTLVRVGSPLTLHSGLGHRSRQRDDSCSR